MTLFLQKDHLRFPSVISGLQKVTRLIKACTVTPLLHNFKKTFSIHFKTKIDHQESYLREANICKATK